MNDFINTRQPLCPSSGSVGRRVQLWCIVALPSHARFVHCQPTALPCLLCAGLCRAGAQWEKARQVYEQMQSNGCQPDVVTYTALVSAYERGGQWLLALEAFEEMVARGCWPDAIVYNAIIDALWQTGVVWAQVR